MIVFTVPLPADALLEAGAAAGRHRGSAAAADGHDGADRALREGRQRHPLMPLHAPVLLVAGEAAQDGGRPEGQRRTEGRPEGTLRRLAGTL